MAAVTKLAALLPAPNAAGNRLAVRETPRGYSIEDPGLHDPLDPSGPRSRAFAAAAFWSAGLGVWLLGAAVFGGGPIGVRLLGMGLVMAAAAAALMLRRRRGCQMVEVDLDRRHMVFYRLDGGGVHETADIPFGSPGDVVLIRAPARSGLSAHTSLHVRRGGRGVDGWLRIASGPERDLRALHGRLARDLAPMEQRVAAPELHRRKEPMRPARAFAPLGPDELTAA